jgi:hypothetical protein
VEADDDASQHFQDSSLRMGGRVEGKSRKRTLGWPKGPFFEQSRQKDDSVGFNGASSGLRLKVSKIRDQG